MKPTKKHRPQLSPAANDDAAALVRLRPVTFGDLPVLYEMQLDPQANSMAGTYPRSPAAFDSHWAAALAAPDVVARTILLEDQIVGCISCFPSEGRPSVGYWIAGEYWGRGIASRALELLLEEVRVRPLYARVATANRGSLRVLQKNGFTVTGFQKSPADDRYRECEEATLALTADDSVSSTLPK